MIKVKEQTNSSLPSDLPSHPKNSEDVLIGNKEKAPDFSENFVVLPV